MGEVGWGRLVWGGGSVRLKGEEGREGCGRRWGGRGRR